MSRSKEVKTAAEFYAWGGIGTDANSLYEGFIAGAEWQSDQDLTLSLEAVEAAVEKSRKEIDLIQLGERRATRHILALLRSQEAGDAQDWGKDNFDITGPVTSFEWAEWLETQLNRVNGSSEK